LSQLHDELNSINSGWKSMVESIGQAGVALAQNLADVVVDVNHEQLKKAITDIIYNKDWQNVLAEGITGGIIDDKDMLTNEEAQAILDAGMTNAELWYNSLVEAGYEVTNSIGMAMNNTTPTMPGATTPAANGSGASTTNVGNTSNLFGYIQKQLSSQTVAPSQLQRTSNNPKLFLDKFPGLESLALLPDATNKGTNSTNRGTKATDANTRALAALTMEMGSAMGALVGARGDSTRATGANIGATLGTVVGSAIKALGPVGAIFGGLAGGLIGGLFKTSSKHQYIEPLNLNTSAIESNTESIDQLSSTISDLRSQYINAPSNFTLPSSAAGGYFGPGGPVAGNGLVVYFNVAGNLDQSAIPSVVGAINKAYSNQYSRQGDSTRIKI